MNKRREYQVDDPTIGWHTIETSESLLSAGAHEVQGGGMALRMAEDINPIEFVTALLAPDGLARAREYIELRQYIWLGAAARDQVARIGALEARIEAGEEEDREVEWEAAVYIEAQQPGTIALRLSVAMLDGATLSIWLNGSEFPVSFVYLAAGEPLRVYADEPSNGEDEYAEGPHFDLVLPPGIQDSASLQEAARLLMQYGVDVEVAHKEGLDA